MNEALEAGRKTDSLVATKLMGFSESARECDIPDYSTEMEAAWQVVEKLNADGGCYSLINDDAGHWALSSDGQQSIPEKFPGDIWTQFIIEADLWADTAPLAICIAALKRLEE